MLEKNVSSNPAYRELTRLWRGFIPLFPFAMGVRRIGAARVEARRTLRYVGCSGGSDMSTVLVFFLLASPALAQNKVLNAAIAPACGADDPDLTILHDEPEFERLYPETPTLPAAPV
jgi:hypothetical protein